MRLAFAALAAGLILAPALAHAQAQSQISCAQLPKAAEFVNTKLQPGPNTDAAKRHLEAAQHATSDAQCVAELRKVDYYAKRSMAGDKRAAAKAQSVPPPAQGQAQSQAPAKGQTQSPIACAQLPQAADFVNTKLKPGPNTDAAKQHLAAAQNATSDQQCTAELRQVDYYAKRSLAADQHAARHVKCGDVLHPTRPGGVDYRGPPVPGCLPVRLW
ncbi:MAG TPA: hypothetical protein VGR52_10230 [Stellaceae bacterium]|nr:hypothetical protein [Stellaceae bacterium]